MNKAIARERARFERAQRFVESAARLAREHGGREIFGPEGEIAGTYDELRPARYLGQGFSGHGGTYEFETIVGRLRITLYDDWIAGRFDDPDAAYAMVDCNPFSGKWNWHALDRNDEEYVEIFFMNLRPLLPKKETEIVS